MTFAVKAPYSPAGDQPQAIEQLTRAIQRGEKRSCVLGITGSGKSATLAWTLEQINRPALILTPNKTLAGQLYAELKSLLPGNAVEYFVSYYDYYQPEAYVPASDTFIDKESSVNEAIDRLRHAATAAALSRRDTVVVASVSAIYGLGAPSEYANQLVSVIRGMEHDRDDLIRKLISIGYERNDTALDRGRFRVRGDTVDLWPATDEEIIRLQYFDETIDEVQRRNPISGELVASLSMCHIYPTTHYVATQEQRTQACTSILAELDTQLDIFLREGRLLEAQRLEQRTRRDVEMLQQTGRCAGVENYSRHFDGRRAGEPPFTLLDYFPDDVVVFLDESHVVIPQLSAQSAGDRSRKETLVEHGFRLPSAIDNRPLTADEFWEKVQTCVYVSATPGIFEKETAESTIEMIVRPTGILDPLVEVRSSEGAVGDFIAEVEGVVSGGGRVLATVLTKKMAEELTGYLLDSGVRARYIHSDTDTLERIDILRCLRRGDFDVLVGINLLREGLDLPEVSLVSVFDADREGFLRSETSLIQTIGRAARNQEGRVILYAARQTPAMSAAIAETSRRRDVQAEYNSKNGIVPHTIHKDIHDGPNAPVVAGRGVSQRQVGVGIDEESMTVADAEHRMYAAAEQLDFEAAAMWRDMANRLRDQPGTDDTG